MRNRIRGPLNKFSKALARSGEKIMNISHNQFVKWLVSNAPTRPFWREFQNPILKSSLGLPRIRNRIQGPFNTYSKVLAHSGEKNYEQFPQAICQMTGQQRANATVLARLSKSISKVKFGITPYEESNSRSFQYIQLCRAKLRHSLWSPSPLVR